MLKKIFSSVLSNDFVKNTTVLFTGKIYVTLLSFLVTPVISRLYHPEQYGTFNLYFALTGILSIIVAGGYNNAVLLQRTEKDFYNAFVFTFLLIAFNSTVLVPLLILLYYSSGIEFAEIQGWFLLILPVGIFISSLALTMPQWNLRRKQFKTSAGVEMTGKTSIRVFQVSGAAMIGGYSWILILSDIAGKLIIVTARLYYTFVREFRNVKSSISIQRMLQFARSFRSYPLYNMPGQLLRTFGQQVPVYVTTFFYDLNYLGHYGMATGLIYIPSQLLSSALSSVFFENIAAKKNVDDNEGIKHTTRKMITAIFALGAFPSAMLIVYGDDILTLLLGNQWQLAGEIGATLSLFLLSSLLMGPVVPLFQVYRKEQSYLILTLLVLFSNALFFIVGSISGEYIWSIILFALSNLIWNLVVIIKAIQIAGLFSIRIATAGILVYALLVFLIYSTKIFLI